MQRTASWKRSVWLVACLLGAAACGGKVQGGRDDAGAGVPDAPGGDVPPGPTRAQVEFVSGAGRVQAGAITIEAAVGLSLVDQMAGATAVEAAPVLRGEP